MALLSWCVWVVCCLHVLSEPSSYIYWARWRIIITLSSGRAEVTYCNISSTTTIPCHVPHTPLYADSRRVPFPTCINTKVMAQPPRGYEHQILYPTCFVFLCTWWWGDIMFTCSQRSRLVLLYLFFPVVHYKKFLELLKNLIFRNVTRWSHFHFMHFNKCCFGVWVGVIGPEIMTIVLLSKDLQVKNMQITQIDAEVLRAAAVSFLQHRALGSSLSPYGCFGRCRGLSSHQIPLSPLSSSTSVLLSHARSSRCWIDRIQIYILFHSELFNLSSLYKRTSGPDVLWWVQI